MVIGIIGAGIAGLTAGRLLARAGHEVTILEKSKGYGGRMATRYAGKDLSSKMDHGVSFFTAKSPEFQSFTAELLEKKLVQTWGDRFVFFNGEGLAAQDPNPVELAAFTSIEGMNKVGKYLARWVDVKNSALVGGFTHLGANRTKKRSWIINMTSGDTFEADAIIIATPAPQAYGLLNTTIDEIETLKMVRLIDEVNYSPAFSLMAGYGDTEIPEWEGIKCMRSRLKFISNESMKRKKPSECTIVAHASEAFSREHRKSDESEVVRLLIDELARVAGGWAADPKWTQLHFWRYSRPAAIIDEPYLDLESHESPLALVGDYFQGNDLDAAYSSGYKLAKHWIEKFGD